MKYRWYSLKLFSCFIVFLLIMLITTLQDSVGSWFLLTKLYIILNFSVNDEYNNYCYYSDSYHLIGRRTTVHLSYVLCTYFSTFYKYKYLSIKQ